MCAEVGHQLAAITGAAEVFGRQSDQYQVGLRWRHTISWAHTRLPPISKPSKSASG